MYTGSVDLIATHRVKIEKKDEGNMAYGSGNTFDKYVRNSDYYISSGNKYQLIKLKKSSMLSYFKENRDELNAFIKSHQLNIKKEEDVISLLQYYESIKE